jgi:uncharacterized protein YidB (DUF937 family)
MGLLDNLQNQALSGIAGGSSNSLMASILQMIQAQPGGLQGLLQSFHEKGLGGLASAWVSNGPNPTASAEEIHEVLGGDKVKQLADSAGMSPDAASSAIGQLLPTIVDTLTPNGQVPENNNIIEIASSLLGKITQAKAS